ncbi:MAG: RNA methyltransferase [Bdellovibrionaceae bacterium]|nr:RNA methyltransferase [Pseudobdellovibrionaceae bacterium]
MSDVYVPKLAIGLLHYPILDREKKIVATNVTNFDIHDIARAARVYGAEKYYIIHPMQDQLMFVERVLDHWRVGQGAQFNPSRKRALTPVKVAQSLEKALADWAVPEAMVVATHARPVSGAKAIGFGDLKTAIHRDRRPCFLLFGTGSGMTDEFMKNCEFVLESIRGAPPDDFRHLSVRSAVSICLDRLMGPW